MLNCLCHIRTQNCYVVRHESSTVSIGTIFRKLHHFQVPLPNAPILQKLTPVSVIRTILDEKRYLINMLTLFLLPHRNK